MQFKCPNIYEWFLKRHNERVKKQAKIRLWFAWHPVRLSTNGKCVLGEWVWKYGTVDKRRVYYSKDGNMYYYSDKLYISEWDYIARDQYEPRNQSV
jgi:hypothetical protein